MSPLLYFLAVALNRTRQATIIVMMLAAKTLIPVTVTISGTRSPEEGVSIKPVVIRTVVVGSGNGREDIPAFIVWL